MTIREQLQAVQTDLREWAQSVQGRVEIAADPIHLIGILATSPGAPRIVVMFDSEEKHGDFEELGRVNRKFLVVISRGRGFKLDPGDTLTEGVAGGKPLFDLIEEAREIIRSIIFDRETTNGIPDYLATRRLQLEDVTVDAYQVEFSILTQLPIHNPDATE